MLDHQLGGVMAMKIMLRSGSGEHLAQREYMEDVSPISDLS